MGLTSIMCFLSSHCPLLGCSCLWFSFWGLNESHGNTSGRGERWRTVEWDLVACSAIAYRVAWEFSCRDWEPAPTLASAKSHGNVQTLYTRKSASRTFPHCRRAGCMEIRRFGTPQTVINFVVSRFESSMGKMHLAASRSCKSLYCRKFCGWTTSSVGHLPAVHLGKSRLHNNRDR